MFIALLFRFYITQYLQCSSHHQYIVIIFQKELLKLLSQLLVFKIKEFTFYKQNQQVLTFQQWVLHYLKIEIWFDFVLCWNRFLIGRLYYNGKFNKEPEPQSKQEDSETYTQIQISNFPKDSVQVNEQLLQKAAKQIKVEFQGHLLSMNTIIQIFQRSIDLVKPEYREITLNNREQRREAKAKSNSSLYQQLVLDYNEQVENLIEKKQIDLCQYLQISEEVLQESAMSLEESGQYQQFVMIQATQRIQIKESIPNKNLVILSFQVQILNKKPKELVQMIQALSQANQYNQILIPMAINTILFDYCYDEFQIEEEDLMVMIQNQNIFADLKVQSLLQQLEMIIFQLMGVA